jgi:hypothetical protein
MDLVAFDPAFSRLGCSIRVCAMRR